jgi:hypothetical protein
LGDCEGLSHSECDGSDLCSAGGSCVAICPVPH